MKAWKASSRPLTITELRVKGENAGVLLNDLVDTPSVRGEFGAVGFLVGEADEMRTVEHDWLGLIFRREGEAVLALLDGLPGDPRLHCAPWDVEQDDVGVSALLGPRCNGVNNVLCRTRNIMRASVNNHVLAQ